MPWLEADCLMDLPVVWRPSVHVLEVLAVHRLLGHVLDPRLPAGELGRIGCQFVDREGAFATDVVTFPPESGPVILARTPERRDDAEEPVYRGADHRGAERG